MQLPPTAAIFDLGGVIIDAPFDVFTALEQRSGAARGAVREINTRDPDNNAWARIERGEITVDEFVERFSAEAHAAGHDLPARDVIEPLVSLSAVQDRANKEILAAVRTCREHGLRLGVITNNVRPLRDQAEAGWLFDTFDTVIESSVVGMRKPETRIYQLALDTLGVAADGTVMLDDLGINLKPARALGMHTIKVTDPVTAARELLDLLTR